jgi:hypothetical protein
MTLTYPESQSNLTTDHDRDLPWVAVKLTTVYDLDLPRVVVKLDHDPALTWVAVKRDHGL